jgi:hypothetical protein
MRTRHTGNSNPPSPASPTHNTGSAAGAMINPR